MRPSFKRGLITALVVMMFAPGRVYAGATYDGVMKGGVVNVGLMFNRIPAAFFNEKNEWVGFEMEIATEVVRRIGIIMDRELFMNKVKVNTKTRLSFLTSARIDLTVASLTHTRDRDGVIDFSIPYFFDGQKIMVKKGRYATHRELLGKRIGVIRGTTSETNLVRYLKKMGDPRAERHVMGFPTISQCISALAQGKVAAWSGDFNLLMGFAVEHGDDFDIIGDFISREHYGMGLPENDSRWRDAVNMAIQDLWRDGTYMKIYTRWYGPHTPYALPMTAEIEVWP